MGVQRMPTQACLRAVGPSNSCDLVLVLSRLLLTEALWVGPCRPTSELGKPRQNVKRRLYARTSRPLGHRRLMSENIWGLDACGVEKYTF